MIGLYCKIHFISKWLLWNILGFPLLWHSAEEREARRRKSEIFLQESNPRSGFPVN